MAKTRLFPHRVASSGCIHWQDWWIEDHAGVRELSDRVEGWDYSTAFRLRTSIQVLDDPFRHSTGLDSDSEILLVLVAESPNSGRRLVSSTPFKAATDHGSTRVIATLEIPGDQVAGTLRVYACVVLGGQAKDKHLVNRVASQRGARLAQSPVRSLALEDSFGRFPTEALDFKQLGFPDAPWTLHTTFSDLQNNFMATVRLLINTESVAGKAALDPVRGEKVADAIRVDIVRLLVARIASEFEVRGDEEFVDDSVGLIADTMTWGILGESLRSSCAQYRENPVRFELLLADRINPLRKAISD